MAFDQLLNEGNEMFAVGRWPEAIAKYGDYIAHLSSGPANQDVNLRRVRAHSNRAEAYLKLKKYLQALEDSERALQLDPPHFKSWLRKTVALDGLHLYREVVRTYTELLHTLQLGDRVKSWVEVALKAAERKDRQSRLGDIEAEMNEQWENHEPGHSLLGSAPSLEEYVGPIRVGRTPTMGRGLFATRDIEPGELLIVSNAVTSIRSVIKCEVMPPEGWISAVVLSLEDIVKEAKSDIRNFSQLQRLVQLDTLGGPYPGDPLYMYRDAPPMRYFTPVNALPEGSWRVTDEDMDHPALNNSFSREFLLRIIKDKQLNRHGTTMLSVSELYVLPSLMNHSCTPNVSVVGLYNRNASKVLRASRFIRDGEELFCAYHNIFCPVEERRILSGGNLCLCQRCATEFQLNRDFSLLNFMGSECSDLEILIQKKDLSEFSLEALAKLRRRCITGMKAISSLFAAVPKLGSVPAEEQHWLRAALLVRFLRLLLHPSMQKLPNLPQQHTIFLNHMVRTTVESMMVVDPASELALSICSLTVRDSGPVSNLETTLDSKSDSEEEKEFTFQVECGCSIIRMTYGSGLNCVAASNLFQSYEESLLDFPF